MLPLDDIHVLDFSQSLAAPYATMLLADFGAEVISLEPPEGGDQREILHGSFMPSGGRNKRSLAMDLKADGAEEGVGKLAEWADVVVHNYRPGTMKRLGCDYDSLRTYNENLVYVSVTGFGESGPYSDRPGFDPIAQAMSGLMWATGEPDRKPSRVGTSPIDYGTGLYAAFATMVALWRRQRTDDGGKIEVSLFETAAAFMGEWYTHYDRTGTQPQRQGHTWDGYAPTGLFQTADDLLYLSVPYDVIWERFCRAIDREEWLDDPRFESNEKRLANRDTLYESIEEAFAPYSRDELVQRLLDAGVPAAELQTVAEAARDSHLRARGIVTEGRDADGTALDVVRTPIHLDGSAPEIRVPAPSIGADTDDVLEEIGFDDAEISRLHADGVVGAE